MADYKIVFARSARKELQELDPQVARRILRQIEGLVANPRPSGVVKLEGASDLWRIRVGDWRVVCSISDRDVWWMSSPSATAVTCTDD